MAVESRGQSIVEPSERRGGADTRASLRHRRRRRRRRRARAPERLHGGRHRDTRTMMRLRVTTVRCASTRPSRPSRRSRRGRRRARRRPRRRRPRPRSSRRRGGVVRPAHRLGDARRRATTAMDSSRSSARSTSRTVRARSPCATTRWTRWCTWEEGETRAWSWSGSRRRRRGTRRRSRCVSSPRRSALERRWFDDR